MPLMTIIDPPVLVSVVVLCLNSCIVALCLQSGVLYWYNTLLYHNDMHKQTGLPQGMPLCICAHSIVMSMVMYQIGSVGTCVRVQQWKF